MYLNFISYMAVFEFHFKYGGRLYPNFPVFSGQTFGWWRNELARFAETKDTCENSNVTVLLTGSYFVCMQSCLVRILALLLIIDKFSTYV